MKKTILLLAAFIFMQSSQCQAQEQMSIKEYRQTVKEFRKQVKKDLKNKLDDVKNKKTLNELEGQITFYETKIQDDLKSFYSDKNNREFLLKTKRINNITDTLSGAAFITTAATMKADKAQHVLATFGVNEVLKGITNEDRPFISFLVMTFGKEVIWDGILGQGEFDPWDIAANSVILLSKTDFIELYSDIKTLSPKKIKDNGIKSTVKGFFINERKNPEALRKIKSDFDNLYKAQIDLIKIDKMIENEG